MTQQLFSRKLRIVFSIVFTFSSFSLHADPAPSPTSSPSPFQLSPDQIDQINKELENIDKFFSSLPPEEQMEFLKQVEEAQQMINNMSEQELAELVKEIEEAMPNALKNIPTEAFTKPITQPDTLKPSTVPLPVSQVTKQELSDKEKEALFIIENVIKWINEFLVKANAAPETAYSMSRWIKNGKIKHWSPGKSWEQMHAVIDSIVAKIALLKEQDPVTMEYRYLKKLSEDETIKKTLHYLEQELQKTVPSIDIPTLGIEKMKSASKTLVQKTMSILGNAIESEKLPSKLDALLAKFGVEAEKIKQTEKSLMLRAQQQAQTRPQQGRTITAGRATSSPEMQFSQDYDQYERGGFYSPRSSYSDSASISSSTPDSLRSTDKEAGRPSSGTASTSSSSSSNKPSVGGTPFVKQNKKDPIAHLMDDIIDEVGNISDLIDQHKTIKELAAHLKNKQEGVNERTVTTLNGINEKLQKAIADVGTYNRKIKSSETQAKYKRELIVGFNKQKEALTKLKSAINNIKNDLSDINPAKRYSYFKEEVRFPEGTTLPAQCNSSIVEIAEAIARLESLIQK